jgi:hypothetical protein
VRTKKIRGLKRRQKNIDSWFGANFHIDLQLLGESGYYYCKSKVNPWSNLYYDASYPSDYRKQLFSRLLDIYDNWKSELESGFQDYYLAIWIFDNRFIDSQVVAGIGERISYYEKIWLGHETEVPFPNKFLNNEQDRIKLFNWESAADMDFMYEREYVNTGIEDYYSAEDYFADQRYYRKLIESNKPFRLIGDNGEKEKVFTLKRGNVWIGKK